MSTSEYTEEQREQQRMRFLKELERLLSALPGVTNWEAVVMCLRFSAMWCAVMDFDVGNARREFLKEYQAFRDMKQQADAQRPLQ